MWAAAYGKNDSVKLLLERGADVTARDNRGESALSIADAEKHAETAALLRAAGAGK
jgi:ankyrin repeat protein